MDIKTSVIGLNQQQKQSEGKSDNEYADSGDPINYDVVAYLTLRFDWKIYLRESNCPRLQRWGHLRGYAAGDSPPVWGASEGADRGD